MTHLNFDPKWYQALLSVLEETVGLDQTFEFASQKYFDPASWTPVEAAQVIIYLTYDEQSSKCADIIQNYRPTS